MQRGVNACNANALKRLRHGTSRRFDQSATWYRYRTVPYRTVSQKKAQNSKIQGQVQYS